MPDGDAGAAGGPTDRPVAARSRGAPWGPPTLARVTAAPTSDARPHGDARLALRDTWPLGAGMVPLGVAFGLLVTQVGLSWWWAPLFSGLVYAGSLEFLLVGLVVAAAPLTTVALTTLLVNARHVFYALSFPLHRLRGRAARAYGVFALIDEAYALTATRPAASLTSRRIVWTQVQLQAYWVGGSVAGALLGGVLPEPLDGLAFTLTALFVVLALDAVRSAPDLRDPLVALALAVLAAVLLPGQMLLAAMGGFTLYVAVAARRRARAAA